MKEYLSHFSAAFYWNVPYVEAVLRIETVEIQRVNFTVFRRSEISQTKERRSYLSQVALPAGSVVSKRGKAVASPELMFLQLASKLSLHRLILLGLQLCSHPPGNPAAAITTKQKLKAFLGKTSGHRGHKKASRAIKYIEEGSASIMESIVYMILVLPHSLGGYGLDGAAFNYEIKLSNEAGKRLGQKRCFADLYYKSARLAVEYESFAYHNNPLQQGKDAVRSAILDRQGIEVMHLNTIQLYDANACNDFAFNLAARLGKRIEIRAKKFEEMNGLLRALLPSGKPEEECDNE